jgi:FAD/FMN-containing dehydrogenase
MLWFLIGLKVKKFDRTPTIYRSQSMKRKDIILLPIIIFMYGCCHAVYAFEGVVLNDVHSRLNATLVKEVLYPETVDDVVDIVRKAKGENRAVSISAGRHAMGGQQFGEGTLHISMVKMNDVVKFNREKGIVTVEAGIAWPDLIEYLIEEQKGQAFQWAIKQKQTGANNLSIGGTLSANAHGRGANFKPIIEDVVAFTLVNPEGELLHVDRTENSELFKLVIGGYGLFGVIATVDLQLVERKKIKRIVEVIPIEELPAKVQQRIEDGYLYGDFQYKTDAQAEDFMKVGVFSTYKPVSMDTPVTEGGERMTSDIWNKFVLLAHTDKTKAFETYSQYYLSTNGQVYWSDTHQLSYYDDGYHEYLKEVMADYTEGSLMITEVYVPRGDVTEFVQTIAQQARDHQFDVIYGTMRLIKRDDESFLAWAKKDYACIIFNLRVEHNEEGIDKAKKDFQRIIDAALKLGGSYFLTYHRWARKDQVLEAYPQFPEFLKLKLKYDSQERFQSEWYRFYKEMFKEEISQGEG